MKLSTLLLLPLFPLALIFDGCQKAPPAPNEEVYFDAIKENLRAMEKKDVDGVMATVHPQAGAFESTRELVKMMFEQVDVKYQLSDLKLVTATPEEAKVSFVQRMEKTGGAGAFRDNIVTGLHTLRPDNGKWKIYRTQQLKVTGLDGKPLASAEAEPPPAAPAAPPAPASPAPGGKPAQ